MGISLNNNMVIFLLSLSGYYVLLKRDDSYVATGVNYGIASSLSWSNSILLQNGHPRVNLSLQLTQELESSHIYMYIYIKLYFKS